MLSPLTNSQSHEDGRLADEEFHWLTMRAKGQFGMVMTCATHVQANGKGFPGQLGIFSDQHIEGHRRLSTAIRDYGSLAVVQLYHGGMRAAPEFIEGDPVSATEVKRKGARALTFNEVIILRDDFIKAAMRAQQSGYDGVELHGAHGYLLAQFLSATINQRNDAYGGTLENRSRLLFEIIEGIRKACGPKFLLGVRLSPERFGMQLAEIKAVCQQMIDGGSIDFLDLSLWDCFKFPEEKEHQDKSLLEHFTSLDFKQVILSVAGKIQSAKDVQAILRSNVDIITIGRSGILHHDFPVKVMLDSQFEPVPLPVTRAYLSHEGLSKKFIDYLATWPGFVA